MIMVIGSTSGCGQSKMAGWGFLTAGLGLGLYTGVSAGVVAGKGATVDGSLVGAQAGVSAGLALIGVIVLAATTALDKEEDEEPPAANYPETARERALRRAIMEEERKRWPENKRKAKAKAKAAPRLNAEIEVTCGFQNSAKSQTCFSDQGHSCTGTDKCSAKVVVKPGKKMIWKSTCPGSAKIASDGKKQTVTFNCAAAEDSATPVKDKPAKAPLGAEK